MKSTDIKRLVKRLSEGEGIISTLVKSIFKSGSYTSERGIEILETVYSQIQDDRDVAQRMFDQELINDICKLPFRKHTTITYHLQVD